MLGHSTNPAIGPTLNKSGMADSNGRPLAPKASALPTEPIPEISCRCLKLNPSPLTFALRALYQLTDF